MELKVVEFELATQLYAEEQSFHVSPTYNNYEKSMIYCMEIVVSSTDRPLSDRVNLTNGVILEVNECHESVPTALAS